MEIIKEGQLPSEREHTATCSHCGTLFRFKQGEAEYHSDQRDGDFWTVKCPLSGCGRKVNVSAPNPTYRR